jgi:hypothetical protein
MALWVDKCGEGEALGDVLATMNLRLQNDGSGPWGGARGPCKANAGVQLPRPRQVQRVELGLVLWVRTTGGHKWPGGCSFVCCVCSARKRSG